MIMIHINLEVAPRSHPPSICLLLPAGLAQECPSAACSSIPHPSAARPSEEHPSSACSIKQIYHHPSGIDWRHCPPTTCLLPSAARLSAARFSVASPSAVRATRCKIHCLPQASTNCRMSSAVLSGHLAARTCKISRIDFKVLLQQPNKSSQSKPANQNQPIKPAINFSQSKFNQSNCANLASNLSNSIHTNILTIHTNIHTILTNIHTILTYIHAIPTHIHTRQFSQSTTRSNISAFASKSSCLTNAKTHSSPETRPLRPSTNNGSTRPLICPSVRPPIYPRINQRKPA